MEYSYESQHSTDNEFEDCHPNKMSMNYEFSTSRGQAKYRPHSKIQYNQVPK